MKADVSVLVVDDEPKVLRVTKLSLEKAGYQVDTAGDGAEALDKLREKRFDVLVTDINMPRMTGEQLCMQIEAESLGEGLHIFVATGRTGTHHREWAGDIPNVELMEKPISLRRLVARITERLANTAAACEERE